MFCLDLLLKCKYFSIFAVDNSYQLVNLPLLAPPLHRSPVSQFFLKLGRSRLQLHSRRIQRHVFRPVNLQSLPMDNGPLPQKRVIDQHLLVPLSELNLLLPAGGAAGAIVHDIITLIAVIIISRMRLITRCLVFAFSIQYYLTLAIAVVLNLAKKTISWARRETAGTAKIHPFRNAREEVFAWMGIFDARQRNSSKCKGFRCRTTASPPKTAQKSISGEFAESHRHQISPSQLWSCTDCSKAPPPGSSPQTSNVSLRKVLMPAVSAGERGLRRVGGQQQGKQDISDRGLIPQLQHR